MWRNWQTRWIQVPVKAISYGFKSLHLHQKTKERACPSLLFFHTNNTHELQFALRIALLRVVIIESEETQAQKGFLSPFICTKKQRRGLAPLLCFFCAQWQSGSENNRGSERVRGKSRLEHSFYPFKFFFIYCVSESQKGKVDENCQNNRRQG